MMTKFLIIAACVLGIGAANVAAYHMMKEAPKAAITRTVEKQVEKSVPPAAMKKAKEIIKKKPAKVEKNAAWCAEVRKYVAQYGEETVRQAAKDRGYTRSQMRAAGRCLK